MSDRHQVTVHGDVDHLLDKLIGLIAQTRPATLELTYDREGTPLADGEQPGPDDAVVWNAIVTYPDGRTVVGQHVVQAGKAPGTGPVYALVRVIEGLGGNVVLVDMTDRSDPR